MPPHPHLRLFLNLAAAAEECDIAGKVSLFTWWAALRQRPGGEGRKLSAPFEKTEALV